LFLKKRTDQNVTSAARIEHMRRRIIFSTLDEFDSNVSEANRIKKIEHRDNCSFEQWKQQLETRKLEIDKQRKAKL
jgi:hypothetical protein